MTYSHTEAGIRAKSKSRWTRQRRPAAALIHVVRQDPIPGPSTKALLGLQEANAPFHLPKNSPECTSRSCAGDALSMGPQSCRTIVGPRVSPTAAADLIAIRL